MPSLLRQLTTSWDSDQLIRVSAETLSLGVGYLLLLVILFVGLIVAGVLMATRGVRFAGRGLLIPGRRVAPLLRRKARVE